MKPRKVWYLFVAGIAIYIVLLLTSLNLGKVQVNIGDMFIIFGEKLGLAEGMDDALASQKLTVFWDVRLSRCLLASLVGAALSVAGAVMQTLYRNPLASPDILGVTQGANLGAGVAIFFFSASTLGIQITAFLFGLASLLLTFMIVSRLRGSSVTALILIGVVFSAVFQAGLTLLMYLSDPYAQMVRINFWLWGAFNTANWNNVTINAPIIISGILVLSIFSWRLNILGQSDEEAQALGVNIKLWRLFYIFFVALIVSVGTATVGNIAWVGLMIPHISRAIIGTNQRQVVPFSAICGAVFILGIDTIVRNFQTGEVPISVITSIVVGPFIIVMILSKNRRGEL